MHQVMGYEGVCVMRDMRYEGGDCIRDAEGNQFTLILPMFSHSVLAVAALIATAIAHNEPQTPEQVEVQRALQAAAYHVCHSKFRMACYTLMISGGSALQRVGYRSVKL
jgi:hypothetical protein